MDRQPDARELQNKGGVKLKTVFINVYMTDSEKATIEAAAKKDDRSLSNFLKQAALKEAQKILKGESNA